MATDFEEFFKELHKFSDAHAAHVMDSPDVESDDGISINECDGVVEFSLTCPRCEDIIETSFPSEEKDRFGSLLAKFLKRSTS